MAYQGVFPKSSFPKTGLPETVLGESGIEAHGQLNLLKAGLVFADAITTVSEGYAKEIQTSEEFGCGLQDVVKARNSNLTGILNGIDYAEWNPATDETIPHKYDFKTLDLKLENKKALLRQINLPFQETVPLIGMVSRLAEQKGFDIIIDVFEELMQLPIQIVVLGVGEKRYHDFFTRMQKKYPEKVSAHLTFDGDLAHFIEAGSDMFLMASRYEPCGLNQLYSLKYGTVPIVRATGGLEDTVEDYSPATGSGTGFKFTGYNGAELLGAVKRAVETFTDKGTWKKIIRNGMGKDFSWDSSARKYLQLYRALARA
jgi:starch synthase